MAGRMAEAVPVREIRVGAKPEPEVMERSPSRSVGCEGAKLRRSWQKALAERVVGQVLLRRKSPVRVAVRGKGTVPVLVRVTVSTAEDTVVTVTGDGKFTVAVETVR